MRYLRNFLLLLQSLRLGVLLVNLISFPTLRPVRAAPTGKRPRVSLLIPMRNEAHNLPENLPSWLRQGADEVLLLDDHSEDDSRALAGALAGHNPHFRLLAGEDLPAGWMGKTWACMQLGQAASGDILIFTDADVHWEDGALDALLDLVQRSDADLLTVWPRHQVGSLGERLLVPYLDVILLTTLPYPLVYTRYPLASAGNGQVMAFRRAAYQRLGGHQAVRKEVLEDMMFARKLKAQGGKLRFALGGQMIRVRMYKNYKEVLEGFGKNFSAFHWDSRSFMVFSAIGYFLIYTIPFLFLPKKGWRRLIALVALERLLVILKSGRRGLLDLSEVLLTPLAPVASLPLYRRSFRRRYRWKGREYRR
jgi:glycosyltransferase involved in cell wall biosynthesis